MGDTFHPVFQTAVEALRGWAAGLQEGTVRPEDVWTSLMGWLEDFMRRVGRWESAYVLEWEGTPVWLKPDEVPLGEALALAVEALERMADTGPPDAWAAHADAWCQTLVALMPWVVWGGPATPPWYRCIVATYGLDPVVGERLLERIYETARQSDDEAIRLLARGALDYFRLRRARRGGEERRRGGKEARRGEEK